MTLLVERPPSPPRRDSMDYAAHVQHELSNNHDLAVADVLASCDVRGALGVGGDIVDLIEVEGQVLAILGDVSGKGGAASLIAAMMLASVQHHAAQIGARPGLILIAVEASMSAVLARTGMIVTLVVAAIDPIAHTVCIASAGHHPVLLRTSDAPAWVVPTCPPLGVVAPCGSERTLPFVAGATLVLASDGITDQPDAAGDEFGLDGLNRALARSSGRDPRRTVAAVLASVQEHAGSASAFDDRAVVVVTAGGSR